MKIVNFYAKSELKKLTVSRTRFYYTVEKACNLRGFNRTITVYNLRKDGSPVCLGWVAADTASYVGDYGCAAQLIQKTFGFRGTPYEVSRKDVHIFEM